MIEQLASKKWRMNNLYRIINKNGDSVRFILNNVQTSVLDNIHSRNLILKARQLGMSTFAVLYILDEALFNANLSAGIVSYSLEHAQHIFKRIIGHAIDSLTSTAAFFAGIVQRSAREITFANGSFLRVDTTLRGGAYQVVLVSEYGKTCARDPMKAEEVVTGTLQSVPASGRIIIESTAEGNSGFYADMVNTAIIRGNENLSPLEYRLFFFNWLQDPTYTMQGNLTIDYPQHEYFNKLEADLGIKIDEGQRRWYVYQSHLLGDKIKAEFPSIVSEAFSSSSDAYYFQSHIEEAFKSHRMLSTSPYDALEPVYVAIDIGVNDLTVMIYFQVVHGEIRIIDYYEDNNKGVDHYAAHLLRDRSYLYHTIFLPHDARHRDNIIVANTYEREFRKIFSATQTRFMVLPKTDKQIQIGNAKAKFSRCVFALNKTRPLIEQLGKYRKKWSEAVGKFIDEPLHDSSSHFADSFCYMCQAINHLETISGKPDALAKHRAAVDSRIGRV